MYDATESNPPRFAATRRGFNRIAVVQDANSRSGEPINYELPHDIRFSRPCYGPVSGARTFRIRRC